MSKIFKLQTVSGADAVRFAGLLAALLLCVGEASAVATCTSKVSGNWSNAATWNCVGSPAVSVPGSTNLVVLASPYTVTLDNGLTAASLTINTGATLSDTNGNTLTVTGDITNNGTFTSNNNGTIASTGAAAVISGNGTFANLARLFTSGAAPSIAVGSTLVFTGTAQIRIGRDPSNNAVSGSVLSINGTLNGSGLTSGSTFIRLYASSTVVGSAGVINADTAFIGYRATGTLTNNGTVNIGTISTSTGTGTWTNAANASLTVQTSFIATNMTLNASATGNTVTYNSPATPITPTSNTYYNLAGTGVVCPVSYIILGTSPCSASLFVQGSPTTCTNVTGVGTIAWANPTNAISSNNAYATASNVTLNTTTNYLNCTGFNLAIPIGAIISGITVYIERNASGGTLKDANVYLIKGGTISTTLNGATATSYPTTDQIETHGGQTNLWAATWTVADLNAANFGVAFSAKNTASSTRTVSVDQIQIRVDYSLPALHHIRIEHDGSASSCTPEPITLKACSNVACTAYYTGGDITGINISPTLGSTWTPGSTVSIMGASGGINSGITLSRSSGTATLTIIGTPSPAPSNTYECYNTATSNSGDCNLVFSGNSFFFDVLNHTSDTRQTATVTSCTSGFANQTRSVKFWSTYTNPATGTQQVKIVASTGNADCTTGYSALGTSSASPTTLNLAFGSGTLPQATFSLCYPDVGSVRLDAQYNGSAATGDNGVVILGNDSFIAKPDHFNVSGIKRTSDNFANPVAADATGGSFVAAGDSTTAATRITATVTAKNVHNATTPNYGLENEPEGIMLTVVSPIVAPTGGAIGLLTCKGSVTDCVIPGGSTNFSSGATTVTDLAWNEVGVIQVMSKNSDGSYIGTGEITTPTASSNIGRFFPHHFGVIPNGGTPLEDRADLCKNNVLVADGVTPCVSPTFTYMDEKMNAQFVLTAQAAGGTTTTNYIFSATPAQNFAKLNPVTASNSTPSNTLGLGAVDTVTPTYLTSRLNTTLTASGSFGVGAADIDAPISISRGTNPDGPYAALQIGIAPADSDGVVLDTTSLNLDTNTTPGNDHALIGSTEVRYGILKLDNTYGSELLDLAMPYEVQFWNGSAFVNNASDTLTSLNVANIGLGNYQDGLNTTNMRISNISISGISAGAGVITLTKPLVEGSVDLTLALGTTTTPNISWTPDLLPTAGANLGYLRNKWYGTAYDRDPTARATFGIYKGNSKFIYIRELY